MTSDPKKFNLQVQINNGTTISTLKKMTSQTVSILLVAEPQSLNAGDIKKKLKENWIY